MSGEAVTVLTAATVTDPYSTEPTADWLQPPASSVEVPGCMVWPRDSSEPTEVGRAAVVTGLTVSFPPGTAVSPSSRAVVRGSTWQVDGLPFAWRSPYTAHEEGVVVNLKQVEG